MKYKIGIIGGSGAFATSYLLQKINETSVAMYGSKNDSEFLDTVTVSTPYSFLDYKGQSTKATIENLIKIMHQLETIDCNVIVMACNTLHQYWSVLNNKKLKNDTVLLHLPKIVAGFIENDEENIGVLCSEQSRFLDIYKSPLNDYNKKIVYPPINIQSSINFSINSVIQNNINKQTKQIFDICLYSLFEKNVDSVILGCTELSILKPKPINKKIYDSVELLAIYLNQNFKGNS